MIRNKRFGSCGKGNFTPFHRVHLAMSGEVVNELNNVICNCDVDVNPAKINEGNAEIIQRCLNEYDALADIADAVPQFLNWLQQMFPDKPLFFGGNDLKSIALQNLETAMEKLNKVQAEATQPEWE